MQLNLQRKYRLVSGFPDFHGLDVMIDRMDSPGSLNASPMRGGTSGYKAQVMIPSASMVRRVLWADRKSQITVEDRTNSCYF